VLGEIGVYGKMYGKIAIRLVSEWLAVTRLSSYPQAVSLNPLPIVAEDLWILATWPHTARTPRMAMVQSKPENRSLTSRSSLDS
jgi:hypothetical protein